MMHFLATIVIAGFFLIHGKYLLVEIDEANNQGVEKGPAPLRERSEPSSQDDYDMLMDCMLQTNQPCFKDPNDSKEKVYYDTTKCTKVAECKPKTFSYMGKPYDGTCVGGENMKRPWCSTKTNKDGQHIGEKYCCNCEGWLGDTGDCHISEGPDCPAGWVKNRLGCYLFGSKPMDQMHAYDFCVIKGLGARKGNRYSDLIWIESDEEAKYIQGYINSHGATKDFWLGARIWEGKWLWTYKGKQPSKGKLIEWTNWNPNQTYPGFVPEPIEPNYNGHSEACAHLGLPDNYLWNACPCNLKKLPLCKYINEGGAS